MTRALREAYRGIDRGEGGPFGVCIVKGDKVISSAHNTVLKTNDPTSHAEMNAIRKASRKLKTWNLSGCSIFSTTEPCSMCFSAMLWARIGALVYGTSIDEARLLGFNEISMGVQNINRKARKKIKITKRFMYKECRELFGYWKKNFSGKVY